MFNSGRVAAFTRLVNYTPRREVGVAPLGMPAPNPQKLFWSLADELYKEDSRVAEDTIMNARCLRVGKEFLALVDYKGSGLVVKLPKARVAELIEAGKGQPFGPGAKIFKEWLSVPKANRKTWLMLLREGIEFVG